MKIYHYVTASLLTALFVGGTAAESSAQRLYNGFAPYSSVSFGVGSSHYYGDLAGYRRAFRATYIMPRWNVGLGYTRQFTPKFAARAMFTWARIAGDDYTFNKVDPEKYLIQYARNLHFRNDLKEFSITGIYNFIPDGRNSNARAKITPYVFGGLALLAHSPEARTPYNESSPDSSRRWVKLQPLRTEGQGQPGKDKPYSLVTLAVPVGIGVRYTFNESFNIGFEIGYRYTFTDYLDDVGGNPYPDQNSLQGIAGEMSNRRFERIAARKRNGPDRYAVLEDLFNNGTAEEKAAIQTALETPLRGGSGILRDGYILTNLSIHYIIPGKIKCPPIK